MRMLLMSAAIIGLMYVGFKTKFSSVPDVVVEDEEISKPIRSKRISKSSKPTHRSNRSPASVEQSYRGRDTSALDQSAFNNQSGDSADWDKQDSPAPVAQASPSFFSDAPSAPSRNYDRSRDSGSSDKSSASSTPSTSNTSNYGTPYLPASGPLVPPPTASPTTPDDDDDEDEPAAKETLTCSSNIGGGSFSNPIQLTINCSAAADIKYCISEGSCCDPSSGESYSGPITVGAAPKDYCVSFIGNSSAIGDDSDIKQLNFKFSSSVPNIQTSPERTFFQTTQLEGKFSIASNHFGSDEHNLSLINLKEHDPSPAGLNLSCQEIYNDHSTLMTPSTRTIINNESVASYTPSVQVNQYLSILDLVYGKNFITTIMRGQSFSEGTFGCVTNEITLVDFEYSQMGPGNSSPVVGGVREFIGGFSEVGFFEEEATVFRGPAGESLNAQSGQELRSGAISMFYLP